VVKFRRTACDPARGRVPLSGLGALRQQIRNILCARSDETGEVNTSFAPAVNIGKGGTMRGLRLLGPAALVALLAACPGDRPADQQVGVGEEFPATTVDPAPAPAAAPMQTVQVEQMHNSGVSGEAHLMPRNGRTDVHLTVRAIPANTNIEARIHRGTCEAPGEAVANLSNVSADAARTGRSETDVGHPSTLLTDGQHVLILLPTGADAGQAPLACGELHAGAAGGMQPM
jgi:hypothetical protein